MKTGLTKFALLICLVLQASISFAADRITFIHTDASGTPIAGSDENGKLAWKTEYYPFGDQFETTSKCRESTLGFTGKSYEKDIGLNYFGARFYDPLTGRFISMDPAPIEASNHYSVNRYAYANNNPYKYIDPDGRLPVIPILIFLAKEIAADKLSQATGGASDFLSVRRAASKVARVFSKKVSTKKLDEARAVRDALSTSASKLSNSKRPATVTAGVNIKTGEVAARACGGGKCAEDHVVDALGGNKANVRFTEAVRPRKKGEQVPVCTRCEQKYGRGAFPKETTKFQSDNY